MKYVDFKGDIIAFKIPGTSVKFYENKDLKGAALLTVKGGDALYLSNGEKCFRKDEAEGLPNDEKEFLECEILKCRSAKKISSVNKIEYHSGSKNDKKAACPHSFLTFWDDDTLGLGFSSRLVPVSQIDHMSKRAVVVAEDGKLSYVSIAECIKNSKFCTLLRLESSLIESDYLKFMTAPIEKEEMYRLKDWRKNLLPCVKKKDKECILKFITTRTSDDFDSDMLQYYPDFGSSLTDENLKELEACIVKGQLLPHGFAYMGNKKVCILDNYFNTRMRIDTEGENGIYVSKIVTVDYPDAIERDPHGGAMSPANLHKDIFYREVK